MEKNSIYFIYCGIRTRKECSMFTVEIRYNSFRRRHSLFQMIEFTTSTRMPTSNMTISSYSFISLENYFSILPKQILTFSSTGGGWLSLCIWLLTWGCWLSVKDSNTGWNIVWLHACEAGKCLHMKYEKVFRQIINSIYIHL